MEPAGSACQAVVRWVITPLAASPASFQPSKAAMMTGALSLPIPLSSIAHHLLPRLLAMPVLSLRAPSDHWLSCPLRHGTAPRVLARGDDPRCPKAPFLRHGALGLLARRLDWEPMTRNDRTARNSNPRAGGPAESLRAALAQRVVVADGAMGTMLQDSSATLSDFDGHEGCNEVLNITRPDIVRSVHDGYLEAGVDCITTNTFGANLGNLGEYGLEDRVGELSEAGARIARQAADAW